MSVAAPIIDPFASALRYATAPFARGAAVQDLALGPDAAGLSTVAGYSFDVFCAQFDVQPGDLDVSYLLTLLAAVGDTPVTVELVYRNAVGSAMAEVLVPAGSLPGMTFVVPIRREDGLATLQSLRERPAAAPGAPAGHTGRDERRGNGDRFDEAGLPRGARRQLDRSPGHIAGVEPQARGGPERRADRRVAGLPRGGKILVSLRPA